MNEMHNVPYAGYPGYQKTITTVRNQYFWPGMNKDVVDYITRCIQCKKEKVEHRHPIGLLQPLTIPEWKWGVVTIPSSLNCPGQESNMVVVDKLNKEAHFIPVKSTHKTTNLT